MFDLSTRLDLEDLKSRFGQSMRVGPIEEVDAKKGYRIKLADGDDGPFLSPWIPHPETGKSSVPLKKGQTVGVLSPTGDMRQGMMVRHGYSPNNDTPNEDMAANVFEDAGVRVSIADGVLYVTGASKVVADAPGVSLGGEGGARVARVGDRVRVSSGSSAGMWPIVEGSKVVTAVD